MALKKKRERHPDVIALLKKKQDWIKKPDGKLFSNSKAFTPAAQHFREYGNYTNHPVSKNSKSGFHKYWVEEARRCVHGFSTGYDWITGYNYFYLNYSPIIIAEELEDDDGSSTIIEDDIFAIQSERIEDFPDFWDYDYEYFHYIEEAEKLGKNGTVLKARTKGFSHKGGSMCNRNYFLIPRSKSYVFADKKQYLEEDGILTKCWDTMSFIDQNTAWSKRRQSVDRMYHKRSSFNKSLRGISSEYGYKSEIIGVPFKGDYNKARGKRGKLILYEEAGDFTNLLQAWNVSQNLVKSGRRSFGMQIAFGTGGTIGNDFLGLESLFYSPDGYNVHSVTNKWDNVVQKDKSGFFVPMYKNLEGFIDENGNSKEEEAKAYLNKIRDQKKASVRNKEDFLRHMAEEPFTPQEAVIRIGGTLFPIEDLKAHLEILIMDSKTMDSAKYGYFILGDDEQTYEFRPGGTKEPILDFPIEKKELVDISGAIVIWEAPVRSEDGSVVFGRYLAGNDPYAHDEASTVSLGSTFVMDKVTKRIVAEYTGRPSSLNIYHENVRRLMLFYNASLNFENNLPGLKSYFINKHSDYLLCDTPESIKDKVADRIVLNRGKGSPATEPINKFARELILAWLLESVDKNSDRRRLQDIKSIPLLKELIYWNKDGNFDRVSALGMLMILDEDRRLQDPENESTASDMEDEVTLRRIFDKQ